MTPKMQQELARLQELLAGAGAPFSPNEGATLAQIEAVEREIGFRLGDDLRALYRFANGAASSRWFVGSFYDLAFYQFASLQESLNAWRDCFPYDDPNWKATGEVWNERVQPELLFHRRWFPFAEWNNFSCCLHFDADPTPCGAYGQIIAADHDPDKVYYVADDFSSFLCASNDLMERKLDDLRELISL